MWQGDVGDPTASAICETTFLLLSFGQTSPKFLWLRLCITEILLAAFLQVIIDFVNGNETQNNNSKPPL